MHPGKATEGCQVAYFEEGHFLTPLTLGMVPFEVSIFCKKKTGLNRLFSKQLVRRRPGRIETYSDL